MSWVEKHFCRRVPGSDENLNINVSVQTVYFNVSGHIGKDGELIQQGRSPGSVLLNGKRRSSSSWSWKNAESLLATGDWVECDPPANMITDKPPEEVQIDYSKLSDLPESGTDGDAW